MTNSELATFYEREALLAARRGVRDDLEAERAVELLKAAKLLREQAGAMK